MHPGAPPLRRPSYIVSPCYPHPHRRPTDTISAVQRRTCVVYDRLGTGRTARGELLPGGGTGGGRAGEPSMNPLPYLPKISAGKMSGVGQMPQRNPAATKPQLFRNLTPLAFAVRPPRYFPLSSAPLRYLWGVQACAHQLPPSVTRFVTPVTPIVTHHCSPVRRPPVPVCSWPSAPVVAFTGMLTSWTLPPAP